MHTQHDSLWQNYERPRFRLKSLSVRFPHPKGSGDPWYPSQREESWLHWLLYNSVNSLKNLSLVDLGDDLPEDAHDLLQRVAPGLLDLTITGYEGQQLIGDLLALHAAHLCSLTLGGNLIEVEVSMPAHHAHQQPRTIRVPCLASSEIVRRDRGQLRVLEIQNLQLFERLRVQEPLKSGLLPRLRQITLAQASRLHPEVHNLDKYCVRNGIQLRVKR